MTESDCLVSRQPIYGKAMNVAAYELKSNYLEDDVDPEVVLEQVRTLYKMFTANGLDEVVGETKGIVALTPDALDEALWKTIPKARVSLEYLQPFEASDEAMEQLQEIASDGYRLALSGKLSQEVLE